MGTRRPALKKQVIRIKKQDSYGSGKTLAVVKKQVIAKFDSVWLQEWIHKKGQIKNRNWTAERRKTKSQSLSTLMNAPQKLKMFNWPQDNLSGDPNKIIT